MLDKTLLDIIVCPNCKGPLTYKPMDSEQGVDTLVCKGEGLVYPVRDGIPVLLVDEAQQMQSSSSSSDASPVTGLDSVSSKASDEE